MLEEKFPAEVPAIFAQYPPEQKRPAVMARLFLVQFLSFVVDNGLARGLHA